MLNLYALLYKQITDVATGNKKAENLLWKFDACNKLWKFANKDWYHLLLVSGFMCTFSFWSILMWNLNIPVENPLDVIVFSTDSKAVSFVIYAGSYGFELNHLGIWILYIITCSMFYCLHYNQFYYYYFHFHWPRCNFFFFLFASYYFYNWFSLTFLVCSFQAGLKVLPNFYFSLPSRKWRTML